MSPSGATVNDGSLANPWPISYAITGAGGTIASGDTVFCRGGSYSGTYASTLSTANPIKFVAYHDGVRREKPILNGRFQFTGARQWLWGWEVFDSTPTSGPQIGIDMFSVQGKLINCIVHDAGHSGVGFWHNCLGGEMNGCISYNNGTADNLDHGIYFNNTTSIKTLKDCIVFNNWAYGFHGYSPVEGELVGITLDGCVGFGGHGIGAFVSPDVMIGGSTVDTLSVTTFCGFKPDGYTSVDLGYIGGSDTNEDAVVNRCTFVGTPGVQYNRWSGMVQTSNRSIAYGSKPTSGTSIIVRANSYESGRGHVVIYNWASAADVAVDISPIVSVGSFYYLRSVQSMSGATVLSGTYGGGSVQIPMSAITAAGPIGRSPTRPLPTTGPIFDTFLVQSEWTDTDPPIGPDPGERISGRGFYRRRRRTR
jgi:hypothetical protein